MLAASVRYPPPPCYPYRMPSIAQLSALAIVVFILFIAAALYLMYKIGRLVGEKTTADKFPEAKKAAVQRSRSVLSGMFAEQLAPYLPNFPFSPTEAEIHWRTDRLPRLQRHGRPVHRGSDLRRSEIRISAAEPQRAQTQRRDRKQTRPLAGVPRPRSCYEGPRHRNRARALSWPDKKAASLPDAAEVFHAYIATTTLAHVFS